MSAHTQQEFDLFMSQLKETNATLDFYCDFKKIAQNVDDIAISLHSLNFLLGKKDLRSAVEALWKRDKSVFDVMDILIATRKKDNKQFLDDDGQAHPIHSLFQDVDGVMTFLYETGLAEVLIKPEVSSLLDYVFGVETGLDTNARKNRSGLITERYVSKRFSSGGIQFIEQYASTNDAALKDALGVDKKVFDFYIKTNRKTYLVEVNFYSGGGSKLNEVARSYTDIAPKINALEGYEFVWITDGIGWNSAKSKLQEAFAAIPSIYNLSTLKDFISKLLQEGQ